MQVVPRFGVLIFGTAIFLFLRTTPKGSETCKKVSDTFKTLNQGFEKGSALFIN
jgi:hypothetical protein